MEEKDYKKEFEELQKKFDRLSEDYDKRYKENYELNITVNDLRNTNEKLLITVKNLSEALASR